MASGCSCWIASTSSSWGPRSCSGSVCRISCSMTSGSSSKTALRRMLDDKVGCSAAGDHDLVGFLQPADELDNALLRLLDIAQPDRARHGHVLAQHVRGPAGHVLEDAGLDRLAGALEGQRQLLGIHFLEHALDRTVVQHSDVLEHEHVLLD